MLHLPATSPAIIMNYITHPRCITALCYVFMHSICRFFFSIRICVVPRYRSLPKTELISTTMTHCVHLSINWKIMRSIMDRNVQWHGHVASNYHQYSIHWLTHRHTTIHSHRSAKQPIVMRAIWEHSYEVCGHVSRINIYSIVHYMEHCVCMCMCNGDIHASSTGGIM